MTGSQRWASVCERKKEGRKKEGRREAGREEKKRLHPSGAHIQLLNSAAALLCHLPWRLGRGMWLLSAGGINVCESTWHPRQSNKVRVTPTQALAGKGWWPRAQAKPSTSTWPPSCQGLPGSLASGVSQRSHRVSGFAVTSIPFNVSLWKRCPNVENSRALDVAWLAPSLSFGVLLLTLPTPPAPGPFLNASSPGLQYGWQVLPNHVWFHGWLMGVRVRWDGGFD